MIVSIDIGTSYSSICRLGPDGRAQPVDISTGASMFGSKYSLPSAVFVEDSGNVLVGQAAMNSRKHRPQNFRMEFKRNLGEDVPILLGERSFLPEDLYTELFRHMKACAEKVDGEQVERAFLTYPASYGKKRKEKLCVAAKAAGLFDLELVDEPTAAAMCYCAEGYIEDGQTLLVYDFGGGTFDVSVIRYKDGAFRLLAEPEGLERCGGMDIDYLIARDMWETVGREVPDGLEALEKNQNRHMRFTSQLNELAVKAKHHLSAAEVFEEYIEIGADDVCYRLTAERFNEMAAPLVGQTIQTCRHALEEAGVSASELSAVLLVGGTSRIPLVKEMAQKISGKQPLCAADLELAVAQGALEYCIYQERDEARREEEAKAEERARQEAEEKKRKEQEAKAKKKTRQEAEEKKPRKQEEDARERECQKAEEKEHKRQEGIETILKRNEIFQRNYKKAKEGEASDMYYVACCYDCLQDYEKALCWYMKAIDAGNYLGLQKVGIYHEMGRGTPQDIDKAIYWYRKNLQRYESDDGTLFEVAKQLLESAIRKKTCLQNKKDFKNGNSLDKLVSEFIDNNPYVLEGKVWNCFSAITSNKLKSVLGVPSNETILLVHDDSIFKNGKSGFIFTNRGFYYREGIPFAKVSFIEWSKFVQSDIQPVLYEHLSNRSGVYVVDFKIRLSATASIDVGEVWIALHEFLRANQTFRH